MVQVQRKGNAMATMAMEGVMATQWQQDGDGQRYRKGNKWSNSGAMAMTAMDAGMLAGQCGWGIGGGALTGQGFSGGWWWRSCMVPLAPLIRLVVMSPVYFCKSPRGIKYYSSKHVIAIASLLLPFVVVIFVSIHLPPTDLPSSYPA